MARMRNEEGQEGINDGWSMRTVLRAARASLSGNIVKGKRRCETLKDVIELQPRMWHNMAGFTNIRGEERRRRRKRAPGVS